MQLLVVHQILIASAIALAVLFGLRSAAIFARGGGAADLALAAASLAVAAALYLYFRKVREKWRKSRAPRA
jgi:hypothetical protein